MVLKGETTLPWWSYIVALLLGGGVSELNARGYIITYTPS